MTEPEPYAESVWGEDEVEIAFAKAVGDCFDCYCAENYGDEDEPWSGEHDDECNREGAYQGTLWALGKLRGQWSVVQHSDGEECQLCTPGRAACDAHQ